ncbi:MAG: VCBS repeat-containing protein [Planctomycetota bacterium]
MPNSTFPRLLALLLLAPFAAAQQRKGVFDAPMVIADKHHVFHELGDFDGDGFVDAIGFWPEMTDSSVQSGQLACWFNDGLGKLELGYDLPTVINGASFNYTVYAHGLGDVDQDGFPDFVFATGNQLRVFLSRGRGVPVTCSASLASPQVARALTVGDFDSDGSSEIAVIGMTKLELYRWNPAQQSLVQVAWQPYTISSYTPPVTMLAAHFDGDATLDFAVSVGTTVELFSFATSSIQSLGSFVVPATPAMMSVGDIDGDGDDDIVDFGMTAYSVLRRTGPQAWQLEAPVTGGPATNFADVDGDGDLDGVCCGGGPGRITAYNQNVSYFRVAHNDGTGGFVPAIEIPGVGSQHIAGVADLEHDGDMDLVGGRCVYYPPSPITAPVLPMVADAMQDPRTVHDLDHDGDPDFLTALGATVANQGDGSTTTWSNTLPAPPPGGAWTGLGYRGDFDGDGTTDLLVGLELGGSTTLEFLANCGGGSFEHRGQALYAVPGTLDPRDVLVLDFDADGDLDFVTQPQNFLYGSDVYANDGAAHFTYRTTIDNRVIALVDVDGDLDLDAFVATGNDYSGIYLTRNLGGGVYAAPTTVTNFTHWVGHDQLAIADLDADGDVDLAYMRQAASNPFSLYVFVNDGAGNFTSTTLGPQEYGSTSVYARQVIAFDADGDGRLDLVAGPVMDARTAVDIFLRRHDNSGWAPPVRQTIVFTGAAGAPMNTTAVCDVDGDGDLDFVTDRVVKNRSFIPATAGRRRQLGTSDAGSGGVRPTLGASGPFRSGSTTNLRVTGARPLTTGRLYATPESAPSPIPTVGMHVARGLTMIVPFTTSPGNGADGSGTWSSAFPITSVLANQPWSFSVQLDDPAGAHGRVATNQLELVFGL